MVLVGLGALAVFLVLLAVGVVPRLRNSRQLAAAAEQLRTTPKRKGRSRSRRSRREIIELTGWLHQGRLINHLAAARGFGEGQAKTWS